MRSRWYIRVFVVSAIAIVTTIATGYMLERSLTASARYLAMNLVVFEIFFFGILLSREPNYKFTFQNMAQLARATGSVAVIVVALGSALDLVCHRLGWFGGSSVLRSPSLLQAILR